MNLRKTMAAAGLVALLGGTAACGGNSSSTASASNSGGPADAAKATFCATFTALNSKVTPTQVSSKLAAVGTPTDISTQQRHGFEVLIAGLAKLPDNAKSADFSKMQKSLSATDQADVQAFGTYLQQECAPASSTSPSASPSPSN